MGTRAPFLRKREGIVPITEAPGTFGAAITPEEWAFYVLDNLSPPQA